MGLLLLEDGDWGVLCLPFVIAKESIYGYSTA